MTMTTSMERVYNSHTVRAPRGSRRASKRDRFLKSAALVMVFLTVGAAAGLLSALKKNMAASWTEQLTQYRWLVLVRGSQVDIDEVGRSLEQYPGVKDAAFISSQQVFEALQNDTYLQGATTGLSASAIPSAWAVTWTTDIVFADQPNLLDDTKRLPGVVDVALDESALSTIRLLREHWLALRFAISVLIAFSVLTLILAGLRFFIVPPVITESRPLLLLFGLLSVAWAVGATVGGELLNAPTWGLLALGMIPAAVVTLWRSAE
jgi:cell division protein FtsX